jgi:Uma2 family endonuclease
LQRERNVTAPVGLILDEANGLQPDLVYVSRQNRAIITRRGLRGVPDLIVEILSPGTESRDRGMKARRYAAAGVRYYWIVAPETRTLEEYELHDGTYRLIGTFRSGEVFHPAVFPGLAIPIAELWNY